jgi:hypothetical protein
MARVGVRMRRERPAELAGAAVYCSLLLYARNVLS